MSEAQNYTPGESLYVFGGDASLKIDATTNNKINTLNLELTAGERISGKSGLSTDHSLGSINIQLDIFELVALAGVFLGHLAQFSVRRNGKFIEVKRQIDYKTGGVSCYVSGSSGSLNLGVPITSSRVFYASMLCMSRLSKNHPEVPMSALLDSLAGTGLSGNEQKRKHEAPLTAHSNSPQIANSDREIPIIHSNDPARKIPARSNSTQKSTKQSEKA